MAKVKGHDPPETEFAYDDADGLRHYLGEFLRMIFGEGFISPRDPETDIIGKTRRGDRPTQQGEGTAGQVMYREAFKSCTLLWNSLPEECPDPLPDPPPTSKKSVWEAKLEHGVTCSYYDLFMRCCIRWAFGHDGEMPDGDCFPCIVECIEDPDMAWNYGVSDEEIDREGSAAIVVTGENAPFTWEVSGTGFSLENEVTQGPTNTLYADDTACGSATIFIVGCDENSTTGYVRCTIGRWVDKGEFCGMHGAAGTIIETAPTNYRVEAIVGNKKQIEHRYKNADGGYTGCEDIIGTCAEVLAAKCVYDTPCLEFTPPCADMEAIRPIPCGPVKCRKECERYWSDRYNCWRTSVNIAQYDDAAASYFYYEWEC